MYFAFWRSLWSGGKTQDILKRHKLQIGLRKKESRRLIQKLTFWQNWVVSKIKTNCTRLRKKLRITVLSLKRTSKILFFFLKRMILIPLSKQIGHSVKQIDISVWHHWEIQWCLALVCLFNRPQLNIAESKITVEMKLFAFSHKKKKYGVWKDYGEVGSTCRYKPVL